MTKAKTKQVDLEGKPAKLKHVATERLTVIKIELGDASIRAKESALDDAVSMGPLTVKGVVQQRMKLKKDLYPMAEGMFDEHVEKMTEAVMEWHSEKNS